MKILFLCNNLEINSGWGVVNHYTVQSALKNGHQVTVLIEKNHTASIVHPHLKVIPVLFKIGENTKSPFDFFSQILKIGKMLKNENFDIVHVLVEPYLIFFAFLNHPLIFMSLIGTYSVSILKTGIMKKAYTHALRKTVKLFAISAYTKKYFLQNVICPEDKAQVVTLGVDQSIFKPAPGPVTKKELTFSFVGQIKERKGLIIVLQVIREIIKEYPELKLEIVGECSGEYFKNCLQYISDYRLESNIKFLGEIPTEKIVELYNRSIGNILPSINTENGLFEGFGLIHLEANACGIPTIGSKDCGNESAIRDHFSGFLCEQNNLANIKSAMISIIEAFKNGHYEKYSNNAKIFAHENSWENYFKKIEANY